MHGDFATFAANAQTKVSSDSWATTHPTHPSSLKPDSDEVQVESLKAGSSEVLMETVTLAHVRAPSYRPQVADAGRGDETIAQAREPAHTVTMLAPI